jgi:hypothetical protein
MLIVSSCPMRTIIMCGFLFDELFCLFMLLVCCDCGNVGLNMNNHNQHMIAITLDKYINFMHIINRPYKAWKIL